MPEQLNILLRCVVANYQRLQISIHLGARTHLFPLVILSTPRVILCPQLLVFWRYQLLPNNDHACYLTPQESCPP